MADLKRFAERITELRGSLTKAQIARRAGISPAYLTAIERGDSLPSVPVIRGIADAIPGASRSELLELAGQEDAAVYDRLREAKAARPRPERLTRDEFVEELRGLLDRLEADSDDQRTGEGDRGAPRSPGTAPRSEGRSSRRKGQRGSA